MVDEPNNKMDQVLRNYAAKRREGAAEPSLHPATRRMLQDEVKRVYPQEETPKRGRWIATLFPHLAAVMAVTLVLTVAVLLLKGNKKVDLANLPEQQSATAPAPAKDELIVQEARQAVPEEPARLKALADQEKQDAPADSASVPAPKEAGREAEESEQSSSSSMLFYLQNPELPRRYGLLPPGAQAPATSGATPPTSSRDAVKSESLARNEPIASGATPAIAAPPASSVAAASAIQPATQPQPVTLAKAKAEDENLALLAPLAQAPVGQAAQPVNLGAALRLDFVGVTNLAPVRSNFTMFSRFQLEQAGEQVRFTEQDGGVYVGRIQPRSELSRDYFSSLNIAEAKTRSRSTTLGGAGGLVNVTNMPPPAGTEAWLFRATGFNRALGKQVVFEGQYFAPTNQLGTNTVAGTNRPNLQTPVVLGRATADGTNWVPIRAVAPR